MPMSTCQTSPRCALATGLLLHFHSVEHGEPLAGDVVTKHHIFVLGFQVDHTAAQFTPFLMAQARKLVNDLA